MQIDREIVTAAREPARYPDVVHDPGHTAAAGNDDQFVDVRVGFDDRCGVRLHDVRDVSLGVVPPERAEKRRREHHVADRAQPNEQYAH